MLVGLAQAPPATPTLVDHFLPFVFVMGLTFLFIFYGILRPQKRKEQDRKKMLESIKKNDHVLTSGGMHGVVVGIRDNDVTLRIDDSSNVRVRFTKSAIVSVEKEPEPSKG